MTLEREQREKSAILTEVIGFYDFLAKLARERDLDNIDVNRGELASLVFAFYNKNSKKYNASQMVYQFLLHTTKRDKSTISIYREYKRLQELESNK